MPRKEVSLLDSKEVEDNTDIDFGTSLKLTDIDNGNSWLESGQWFAIVSPT